MSKPEKWDQNLLLLPDASELDLAIVCSHLATAQKLPLDAQLLPVNRIGDSEVDRAMSSRITTTANSS